MKRRGYVDSLMVMPIFLFVLVIALAGFTLAIAFQEKSLTGEVVSVTHESYPWESTTVEIKTYSGSSQSIRFEGHIEVELGLTYRITTKGTWYKQGIPTLIELEQIEDQGES